MEKKNLTLSELRMIKVKDRDRILKAADQKSKLPIKESP